MELTTSNFEFSRMRAAVEFSPVAMESAAYNHSSKKSDASEFNGRTVE